MHNIILPILAAFLAAYFLTPVIKGLAIKMGAVDHPNGRKIHDKAMPRMGGLAIYLAFVLVLLVSGPLSREIVGLILGSTVIVILGVMDDIWQLSPKVKLLGQIVAASLIIPFGVEVQFITNPFVGNSEIDLGLLGIPVTIFWIIGVTNAVNLIDGLDGLAAGIGVTASATLALVAWLEGATVVFYLALLLAASILGFLRYNFHPAQIFMGDTGSMFLGYILAALSVMGLAKGATVISVFVPFLIVGIPIFDTALAIVRRFLNRRPIFEADKDHLHHRLLALGLSHRKTVLIIYGINLLMGITAVMVAEVTTAQGAAIFIAMVVLVLLAAEKVGVIGKKAPSLPVLREQKTKNL